MRPGRRGRSVPATMGRRRRHRAERGPGSPACPWSAGAAALSRVALSLRRPDKRPGSAGPRAADWAGRRARRGRRRERRSLRREEAVTAQSSSRHTGSARVADARIQCLWLRRPGTAPGRTAAGAGPQSAPGAVVASSYLCHAAPRCMHLTWLNLTLRPHELRTELDTTPSLPRAELGSASPSTPADPDTEHPSPHG